MNEKVVVLNGKRFIVGNSKIRPTKCHIDKRKKLISKDEIKKERMIKKKDKIEIMSMTNRRKTKRKSRKMRKSKEKI